MVWNVYIVCNGLNFSQHTDSFNCFLFSFEINVFDILLRKLATACWQLRMSDFICCALSFFVRLYMEALRSKDLLKINYQCRKWYQCTLAIHYRTSSYGLAVIVTKYIVHTQNASVIELCQPTFCLSSIYYYEWSLGMGAINQPLHECLLKFPLVIRVIRLTWFIFMQKCNSAGVEMNLLSVLVFSFMYNAVLKRS